MRKKQRLVVILVLLFCTLMTAVPARGAGGQPVRLRLTLTAGQTFNAKEILEIKVSVDETGDGILNVMESVTGVGCLYRVAEVSRSGVAAIDLVFHSIYSRTPGVLGRENEFDSTDPFADVSIDSLLPAALIGTGFTERIKPDFTLAGIDGTDRMIERIMDNMGLKNEKSRGEMREILKGQFSAGALKKNAGDRLILPRKSLRPGDTWRDKQHISVNGINLVAEGVYTFAGLRDGRYIITAVSQIKTVPTVSRARNAQEVEFDISGEMRGSFELDQETCWPLRVENRLAMTGKARTKDMPQDESLPIRMDVTFLTEPFAN